MSIPHLTPTFSDIKTWVRSAVVSVNLLIKSLANYLPLTGGTLTGDLSVPDEPYGVGWNGSVEVPTKNALYDKIETISAGGVSDGDKGDIVVSSSGTVWSFDSGVVTAFAKTFLDDANAGAVLTTLGAQPSDATLTALSSYNTNGIICQTAADTFAGRTLIGPAAGITVSNGGGVAGNPTLALANDLAALEALSGTNTIYYRSAADTWTAVTIGGGLSFSGGTLSAGWREAKWWDQAVDGSSATVECDVTGAKEILINGHDLTLSISAQRTVQVSVDGGSTWFTTSGDYDEMAATGVLAANAAMFPHTTAATAARSISVHIRNNGFSRKPTAHLLPRAILARFLGSTTAINRVRVASNGAGNINGGTIQFLIK